MDASVNILTYILEDDRDIHDLIEDLLKEHGILNYEFYTEPEEFLSHLTADINICVIDHRLNRGITGLEVTEKVKARNKYSYVIVMSAITNYKTLGNYINLKADAYVDKNEPDCYDQLITELKKGFLEAKERLQFVKFLESKLEKL